MHGKSPAMSKHALESSDSCVVTKKRKESSNTPVEMVPAPNRKECDAISSEMGEASNVKDYESEDLDLQKGKDEQETQQDSNSITSDSSQTLDYSSDTVPDSTLGKEDA